jgi:1-acyl-sn-glycerol-3-phosphate acyltransferase
MRAFIGSIIFFFLAVITGAITSIAVILTALFSKFYAYLIGKVWCRLTLRSLKIFCGLGYRVEGLENIPSSPCVIAIRHSSAWETVAQVVIFPYQTWVMKKELIYLPLFGLAWMSLSPIPIDRKSGRKAVSDIINLGTKKIKDGRYINIFPEGTRMPEGIIGRFGQSASLLAQNAKCSILPVTHNAGKYWKRRGFIKHPGEIVVRIGKPISFDSLENKHYNVLTAEVRDWIEKNKPT